MSSKSGPQETSMNLAPEVEADVPVAKEKELVIIGGRREIGKLLLGAFFRRNKGIADAEVTLLEENVYTVKSSLSKENLLEILEGTGGLPPNFHIVGQPS